MLEATSAELAYRCSAGLHPCSHFLTCRRALLPAMTHSRAPMCTEPTATQPDTIHTRCSSSCTTLAMPGRSVAGTGISRSSHPTGLRHRPPSGHPRACRAATGSTTGAGAGAGASADYATGSWPCQPQAAAQRFPTAGFLYIQFSVLQTHCAVGAFATIHLHLCTCSCQMITHKLPACL